MVILPELAVMYKLAVACPHPGHHNHQAFQVLCRFFFLSCNVNTRNRNGPLRRHSTVLKSQVQVSIIMLIVEPLSSVIRKVFRCYLIDVYLAYEQRRKGVDEINILGMFVFHSPGRISVPCLSVFGDFRPFCCILI